MTVYVVLEYDEEADSDRLAHASATLDGAMAFVHSTRPNQPRIFEVDLDGYERPRPVAFP